MKVNKKYLYNENQSQGKACSLNFGYIKYNTVSLTSTLGDQSSQRDKDSSFNEEDTMMCCLVRALTPLRGL